jgi:hypothetical protein
MVLFAVQAEVVDDMVDGPKVGLVEILVHTVAEVYVQGLAWVVMVAFAVGTGGARRDTTPIRVVIVRGPEEKAVDEVVEEERKGERVSVFLKD